MSRHCYRKRRQCHKNLLTQKIPTAAKVGLLSWHRSDFFGRPQSIEVAASFEGELDRLTPRCGGNEDDLRGYARRGSHIRSSHAARHGAARGLLLGMHAHASAPGLQKRCTGSWVQSRQSCRTSTSPVGLEMLPVLPHPVKYCGIQAELKQAAARKLASRYRNAWVSVTAFILTVLAWPSLAMTFSQGARCASEQTNLQLRERFVGLPRAASSMLQPACAIGSLLSSRFVPKAPNLGRVALLS